MLHGGLFDQESCAQLPRGEICAAATRSDLHCGCVERSASRLRGAICTAATRSDLHAACDECDAVS